MPPETPAFNPFNQNNITNEPGVPQHETSNLDLIKSYLRENSNPLYYLIKYTYPKFDNLPPEKLNMNNLRGSIGEILALVIIPPMHYLYRKMYIQTAVLLTITCAITLLINILSDGSIIYFPLLNLIWIIPFPFLYNIDIKRNIEKYKNQNIEITTKMKILSQVGGVNILSVFLIIPYMIVCSMIVFLVFGFLNLFI